MDLSKEEPPKILYLNPLTAEKRKKHCACKNRGFVIDLENREVTCKICGSIVDPFEALVEISRNNEKYDTYLENRYNYACELNKWFKNNRIPIQIKKLVENYRKYASTGVLPQCPHCNKNFDFSEITRFSNPKFRKI